MDSYFSEEVPVLEGEEAKSLHKKKLAMEKMIIADSIKDHLIPQVSSLKTPKAMFDALTKLFEGKNINQKMTLRNQLKNVKIQNEETIQSYFMLASKLSPKVMEGSLLGNKKTTFEERTSLLLFREGSLTKC